MVEANPDASSHCPTPCTVCPLVEQQEHNNGRITSYPLTVRETPTLGFIDVCPLQMREARLRLYHGSVNDDKDKLFFNVEAQTLPDCRPCRYHIVIHPKFEASLALPKTQERTFWDEFAIGRLELVSKHGCKRLHIPEHRPVLRVNFQCRHPHPPVQAAPIELQQEQAQAQVQAPVEPLQSQPSPIVVSLESQDGASPSPVQLAVCNSLPPAEAVVILSTEEHKTSTDDLAYSPEQPQNQNKNSSQ